MADWRKAKVMKISSLQNKQSSGEPARHSHYGDGGSCSIKVNHTDLAPIDFDQFRVIPTKK